MTDVTAVQLAADPQDMTLTMVRVTAYTPDPVGIHGEMTARTNDHRDEKGSDEIGIPAAGIETEEQPRRPKWCPILISRKNLGVNTSPD